MPFDAMVVSAAVAAMFLLLAGVLAWGDYQTRPERLKGRHRGWTSCSALHEHRPAAHAICLDREGRGQASGTGGIW